MVVMERIPHKRPWGRRDLPYGISAIDHKIGEVWYECPNRPLPILIKSLFTSERLSVQVHPDDITAQQAGFPSGKEEFWFVTAASENATLGIGLRGPVLEHALYESALDGSILDLMEWFPVKAGEFFHIPPGTIHAIGAGVDIVEVQQNVDITYRLYDYGRGRELHLDAGIGIAKRRPHPLKFRGSIAADDFKQSEARLLSRCPHFSVWYTGRNSFSSLPEGDFHIIPLTGHATLGDHLVGPDAVLWGNRSDLTTLSSDFSCLAVKGSLSY